MPIRRFPLAAWQELIDEASEQTGYHCDEEVEHYLALTLDGFITDKNLASVVIAIDFLFAINSMGREGGGKIRKIGDECLLIAGLFPERAEKKHVPLEYFIGMGQEAYHQLTHAHFKTLYDQALFAKLSKEFPNLIDLMQTMRKIPKKPLQ